MQNQIQYSEARGYNLGIARELGIPAACLYNQLLFWQSKAKGDWFYKSYDDMIEELPLSIRTLRRAYDILRDAGYIETELRKANGAPTMHVRICQIVKIQSANLAETLDSAKLAETNNNKENNKESIAADPDLQKQLRNIHRLYLKHFVIPIRLKDKKDSLSTEELLKLAEARYKLSPKRRDAIRTRINDSGYNMVCAAVIGFGRHRDFEDKLFYVGEGNRGWVADLEKFICRTYENIEKGAAFYEAQKSGKDNNDPWANL